MHEGQVHFLPMSISMVIPFFNAARTLQVCLDALARQSMLAQDRIILVNNNSTDESVRIVESFIQAHPQIAMTLLHESKPGASAARNAGARAAEGDWLAFTDADCMPDEHWLADLRRAIARLPRVAAFAGCVKAAPAKGIVACFTGLYTLPPNPAEKTFTRFESDGIGGFPTANLILRKSIFETIGGFDENLLIYGEDHDLCDRIYQQGGTIHALADAVVYHIHRDSLSAMMRQSRGFGGAHAWTLRRAVRGAIIIQAPGLNIRQPHPRLRIWIDLDPADKKLLLALLPGCLWSPLWLLAPLYLCYLAASIARRMRQRGLRPTLLDLALMPWLMLLKSAAMTWGRWGGSVKQKVVCL